MGGTLAPPIRCLPPNYIDTRQSSIVNQLCVEVGTLQLLASVLHRIVTIDLKAIAMTTRFGNPNLNELHYLAQYIGAERLKVCHVLDGESFTSGTELITCGIADGIRDNGTVKAHSITPLVVGGTFLPRPFCFYRINALRISRSSPFTLLLVSWPSLPCTYLDLLFWSR